MAIIDVLRDLLKKQGAGTQAELRLHLEKLGLKVNQSTISRSLRKLGAVKSIAPTGEPFYKLPEDPQMFSPVETSMSDLVKDIVHNDFIIVITTSPGSASLIARNLDQFGSERILGTVAGDDTIFVAVPSGRPLKKTALELRKFFGK